MSKGLTASDLRTQAEKARSRQPESAQRKRIERLTKKLVKTTIARIEEAARRSADRGLMEVEATIPDSVRDEGPGERFIVNIESSVAGYFRSKEGLRVSFTTKHERLDDGVGGSTVLVRNINLSWSP